MLSSARTILPLGLSALALGACVVPVDDEAPVDPAEETAQVDQDLTVSSFTLGARRLFSHTDETGRTALVGDVSGDHCADLVYAGKTSTAVYLSNCTGGFGSRIVATHTDQGSRVPRLADVDGDGDLDLVYMTEQSTGVLLSRRNGTWTYAGATSHTTEDIKAGRFTGDVNGDGRADLIFTKVNSLSSSWYPGLGNGTFGARATTGDAFLQVDQRHIVEAYIVGATSASLQFVAADPATLVAAYTGAGADYTASGTRKVTYLFGDRFSYYDAAGTAKAFVHPAESGRFGLVADVTGDGRDDAVYVGTDAVSAYVSTGTGFKSQVLVKHTNESTRLPVFADANGDGIKDLFYLGFASVALYHVGAP